MQNKGDKIMRIFETVKDVNQKKSIVLYGYPVDNFTGKKEIFILMETNSFCILKDEDEKAPVKRGKKTLEQKLAEEGILPIECTFDKPHKPIISHNHNSKVIASIENSTLKVELRNENEGFFGSYVPNTKDENLLRFRIYTKENANETWTEIPNSSRRTMFSATAGRKELNRCIRFLFYSFLNITPNDSRWNSLCEDLSLINEHIFT